MHTQRIRMLKTMLEEIQAGTWQPTKPVVFDMSVGDWLKEREPALHADLIGCAMHDPRFNAEGLTNRLGSPQLGNSWGDNGWTALTKFFEAPMDELEPMFLPEQYIGAAPPTLAAVLERVSSYCHFWVDRRESSYVLWGPGTVMTVAATLVNNIAKAEWIANELNNALAAAKGQDDHESLKLWGLEP